MIKMIATDMDGSLLDEQKHFPPHFFETMEALQQHGIAFVAATGRSYPKQREEFAPAITKPYFLCDNGAFLLHDGEVLFADVLDRTFLLEIEAALGTVSGAHAVYCGEEHAWQHPIEGPFTPYLRSYYATYQAIQSVDDIQDDILKVAVCDVQGAATNSYPVLHGVLGDRLHCVVSGEVWVDIMNNGINKGKTLAFLQEKLNITPDETVCFGDYYNDIELLGQATHSFVMQNANEDMKQHGRYVAPPNTTFGVQQILSEILDYLEGKPVKQLPAPLCVALEENKKAFKEANR